MEPSGFSLRLRIPRSAPCQSVSEKSVKRIRRQLGIAHRMGDVPVPKVLLNVAGIAPVIRQLVTGSMA